MGPCTFESVPPSHCSVSARLEPSYGCAQHAGSYAPVLLSRDAELGHERGRDPGRMCSGETAWLGTDALDALLSKETFTVPLKV